MIDDPEQTLLQAIGSYQERYPIMGQLEVVVPSWWADLHGRDVVAEYAARCNAILHVAELAQAKERLQMLVYPKGSFVSKRGSMIDLAATPRGYADFARHRVYKYSNRWWFTCGLCVANRPTATWRQALDLLRLHVDDHAQAHQPR